MGKRAIVLNSSVTLSVVALTAILGFLYAILDRNQKQWDLTESGLYTLSGETMKILGGLTQDVEISAFFIKGGRGGGDNQMVMDVLDRYKKASVRIKVKEVDPQLDPLTTQKENVRIDGTLIFRSGGNEKRVLKDDMLTTPHMTGFDPNQMGRREFNGEETITNAIMSVTRTGKKKVCFLQGYGEGDTEDEGERGYSEALKQVGESNLDTETVTLFSVEEIPADCTALVWIAPQKDIPETAVATLDRFLQKGGALGLFLDVERGDSLAPFLSGWGAELDKDIVIDLSRFYVPIPTNLAPEYGFHKIVDDLRDKKAPVILPVARSVRKAAEVPEGIVTDDLLRSSEDGWGETNMDSDEKPKYDDGTDVKGPVSLALAITKPIGDGEKKSKANPNEENSSENAPAPETRILVVGDADFFSNPYLLAQYNRDLFLNGIHWLLGEEKRLSIRAKSPETDPMMLTGDQNRMIFLVSVLTLPLCVVLFGGAVWYGRRNR